MGESGGSQSSEETTGQGKSEDIHVPEGLQKFLKLAAGQTWPEGSEGGLKAISAACAAFDKALAQIEEQLPGHVRAVRDALVGQTGDAIGKSGSDVAKMVAQLRQKMQEMRKSSKNAAADIQKAKIMIVAMLVVLAA